MSIVVGYVPDRTGFLAVTEAIQQAKWRGSAVVVVNTVDEAGYSKPTAADEVDMEAVQQRLTQEGVEHRIEHRSATAGSVADIILDVAEKEGAELIVVGMHRRSPVRKALLGSTAQRVLLDAPCPVLAVRSPEQG